MTKRAWLALCTIVGVSTLFAGCGSDEGTGGGNEKGGKSGTGGASDAGETGTLLGGSSSGGSGGSGGSTGGRAPTGGVGGTAAGSPNTGGKAPAGGATTTVTVGQECLTATSCGDLECLTAEDSGFPQGLCTAGCLEDADCPGATDVCLVFETDEGPAGICLEGCTMGTPPALSDPKCHNRPEMACSLLYLVTGETCTADTDCAGTDELCDTDGNCRKPTTACYPQCGTDNDCPEAMFCDPESGACVDEEVTGDVDGTACDGEAEVDSCLGRCATFVDENDMEIESICVSECTFGAPGQCGWQDESEPAPAICFPRFEEGGEGDQGLCYPLCDCDSDCLADHKCYEYTQSPQEFLTAFGHRGICFYPDETPSLETCE